MSEPSGFWERPEVVARFAERDPDHRLREIADGWHDPAEVRVLDAGCAGGRNTVFLARRGADVRAFDRSDAMVEETRRRLAEVVGVAEARERVRRGRMDDLSAWADGSFDWVVSLGLLHNAETWEEWGRTVAETVRVLAPEGRVLLSQFTPRTDLTGRGARPLPGEPHVYEGAVPERPAVLLEPAELDAAVARLGLVPAVPTAVAEGTSERGRRVSANALYRRA